MSDFWKSLLQNCFIQLKPSCKTQSCVIATYCENASTTSRFYKSIEVLRSYSKDEQKYMIIFVISGLFQSVYIKPEAICLNYALPTSQDYVKQQCL